ncbi:unnamed protein product [Acanthosepion pharaonis]|uniref:Transmembrane protein n=1 Tax=Acanthosepion pharaonis TaxID=158019 RepID=A0A812AUB6_ACAPH|nr:unnamed protein product [Sepia pharaonis]
MLMLKKKKKISLPLFLYYNTNPYVSLSPLSLSLSLSLFIPHTHLLERPSISKDHLVLHEDGVRHNNRERDPNCPLPRLVCVESSPSLCHHNRRESTSVDTRHFHVQLTPPFCSDDAVTVLFIYLIFFLSHFRVIIDNEIAAIAYGAECAYLCIYLSIYLSLFLF